MTKKVYKQKCFYSVMTNNSNWEISAKNSVTFKIWDGFNDERMKNFDFFGIHCLKRRGLDSLQI